MESSLCQFKHAPHECSAGLQPLSTHAAASQATSTLLIFLPGGVVEGVVMFFCVRVCFYNIFFMKILLNSADAGQWIPLMSAGRIGW